MNLALVEGMKHEPFGQWKEKYGKQMKGSKKFLLSLDKIRELTQCVRDNALSDEEMDAYLGAFLADEAMLVRKRKSRRR